MRNWDKEIAKAQRGMATSNSKMARNDINSTKQGMKKAYNPTNKIAAKKRAVVMNKKVVKMGVDNDINIADAGIEGNQRIDPTQSIKPNTGAKIEFGKSEVKPIITYFAETPQKPKRF